MRPAPAEAFQWETPTPPVRMRAPPAYLGKVIEIRPSRQLYKADTEGLIFARPCDEAKLAELGFVREV